MSGLRSRWLVIFLLSLGCSFANGQPQYPLKISADGNYLVDQSDEPFLINGDTPWALIMGLSKSEATLYLQDRRARGFNALLIELIEPYFSGPANRDGELPFLVSGDFSTPNEAYFAHADWVIQQAEAEGMVVFLTPAYLGYECGNQGYCAEMVANGTQKMREYGRWLGARYASFPNIVWVAGGDADAHPTPGAFEVTQAMIEGILERDTLHLVTAHCDRGNAALDCYDAPWLQLNSTYSECTHTALETQIDYERRSVMPFFFIEGSYEDEVSGSTRCARGQAYQSVLGGSTGHFYGNTPVWLFGSGWQAALDAPGAASMEYLGKLFSSRDWHELIPDFDHTVLIQGVGSVDSSDYAGSARTSDDRTFIAYLPSLRTVTIDLTRLAGSQSVAWWYDPRSGISSSIGTFANTQSRQFTPPAAGDWVLVIDDASAGLPAPGEGSIRPMPPQDLRVE